MSAQTFYIAASSSPEGVSAARALASRLEGLGMTCAMRWWECLDAPKERHHVYADACLDWARTVDVFVLLAAPQSAGVHDERRTAERHARAELDVGAWHPFFELHPLAVRVESVDVLLAVLAGEGA